MTVETQSTRVQFKGNGSAASFSLPFPVYRGEHLSLYLVPNGKDAMDLFENAVKVNGGYTVTGAGTDNVRVVMEKPPASGDQLTIARLVPLVQPTDIRNASAFDAEVVEGADDYQEMQIQQLAEAVGRAIKVPVTSNKDPEEFWRELLDACKAAQEALKLILMYADPTALNSYAFNVRRSVAQKTAVASGGTLELPAYYYPKRSIMYLAIDGMVCTPVKGDNLDSGERQYTEIGDDPNVLSNTVTVHFPVEAGATVDVWVVASNLIKEMIVIETMAQESTRQAEASAGSANESRQHSLAAAGNALAAERSADTAAASATSAAGSALDAGGLVEDIRRAFPLPDEADAGKKLVVMPGGVAEWRGNTRLLSGAGEREADIAAGDAFAVPEYVAGAHQLDVRLGGFACDEGIDYAETGEAGSKSEGIIWNIAVPRDTTISVYVRV